MKAYKAAILIATLAICVRGQVVSGSVQPPPEANGGPPGSMSGHVVNAVTGEPVSHAMVSLQNTSRGGNFQSATTDSAGAFSVGSLQPGDYLVQATHANYQGILGLPSPSLTVTVASDAESSGVTIRLMPGGTISGKVVDDGDEPVSGCPIWALGAGQGAGPGALVPRGNATTNDKGEYKLDPLIADRYLLYARCQESLPAERPLAVWRPELIEPAESWLPVYYPDSSSVVGAQWLTVMPGSELSGIDFKLRATTVTTVSGTVSGALSGGPEAQLNIQLLPNDGTADSSLAYGAYVDVASSTFKIPMIPPGSYRLLAIGSPSQVETLAYASIPVNVGRARPTPLLVQSHPGIAVNGVLDLPPPAEGNDGAPPIPMNSLVGPGRQAPKLPPLAYLNFIPLSQSVFSNFRQVEVRQDRTFQAQGLTPGRYKIAVQMLSPRPLSMESAQLGETRADHGVIELAEGASGTLHVRMAGSPPQVSSSLADAPATSRGDWMVFALPMDEPLVGQFQQYMGASGKSGDTVRMQNASVGKFAFVAVEMMMVNAIQNERLAHMLRQRVEPVEIVTGQDQTVKPRFFTTEEIEKLALAYLRGDER